MGNFWPHHSANLSVRYLLWPVISEVTRSLCEPIKTNIYILYCSVIYFWINIQKSIYEQTWMKLEWWKVEQAKLCEWTNLMIAETSSEAGVETIERKVQPLRTWKFKNWILNKYVVSNSFFSPGKKSDWSHLICLILALESPLWQINWVFSSKPRCDLWVCKKIVSDF